MKYDLSDLSMSIYSDVNADERQRIPQNQATCRWSGGLTGTRDVVLVEAVVRRARAPVVGTDVPGGGQAQVRAAPVVDPALVAAHGLGAMIQFQIRYVVQVLAY